MHKDFSRYRLFFIITLFLIYTVNVFLIAVRADIMVITNSHLFRIETVNKNEQNLEFKAGDSTSEPAGLKVETVAISRPVSFDSGNNHLSNLNIQLKKYSKKKCSLISHSNLIISKTLHLSPLITKLQI